MKTEKEIRTQLADIESFLEETLKKNPESMLVKMAEGEITAMKWVLEMPL